MAYSSVFETYAEYSAVPANKLLPVPEAVPLDVAVACGVQVRLPLLCDAWYLVTQCLKAPGIVMKLLLERVRNKYGFPQHFVLEDAD